MVKRFMRRFARGARRVASRFFKSRPAYGIAAAVATKYSTRKRISGPVRAKASRLLRRKRARHADYAKACTKSYQTIVLRRARKFKSHGRWSYLYQNQGSVITQEGLQGVEDMAFHCHVADQLLSNIGTNTIMAPWAWRDNPFEMNPYQMQPLSSLLPQVTEPANDMAYVESCMASMKVVNTAALPVEVTVYICTPRTATYESPSVLWASVLSDRSAGQATSSNPQTMAGTLVSGAPTINIYGQRPEYEKPFFKHYKILKKQMFMLNGGACHDMEYKIMFNKLLDRTYLKNLLDGGSKLAPYLSVIPMVIVRPGPVLVRHGVDDPSGDQSFSTGSARVGWVYTHRYVFKSVPAQRLSYNRAAPQLLRNNGAAIEKLRDIVDEFVTNVIE